MPGGVCSVAACSNNFYKTKNLRGDKRITYFTFPKDPHTRKLWVEACNRKDAWNPDNGRVCSTHFKEEDFERNLMAEMNFSRWKKILKPGSIPSLHLLPLHKISTEDATPQAKRKRIKKGDLIGAGIFKENEDNAEEYASNTMASIDKSAPWAKHQKIKEHKASVNASCKEIEDDAEECQSIIITSSGNTTSLVKLQKINEETEDNDDDCTIITMQFIEEDVEEKYEALLKEHETLIEEHNSLKKKFDENKEALEKEVNKNKALEKELERRDALEEEMIKRVTTAKMRVKEELSKIFTHGQIDLLLSGKKQVKCWTLKEMGMAFSIRYLSKKCYVYLRNQLNFPLPGVSTLQRWVSHINMRQRILEDVLQIMEAASLNMTPQQKITLLQFNEMKVAEVYEFDKKGDEVIGPHKQMMVMMARGLFSQWKQPVYVDFDVKMSKDILEDILAAVSSIGFTVVAVVSDNVGQNIGLWKQLGVSYDHSWFSFQGKKVYCFVDAPHLLKVLRNNFIDSGFVMGNGQIISCDPVRELINYDETELSSEYSLTRNGITLEKKQNAAQLMSHTTVTALRHYDVGEREQRLQVADFIEKVNIWFGIFNSRVPFVNQDIESGLGVELESQLAILDDFYQIILSMRCPGRSSLLSFQKGILMSIASLKDLLDCMKTNHEVSYILTSKLKHDSLDKLFSQVSHKEGVNDHPSPLNALIRMRTIILGRNREVVSRNSNTEIFSEEYITEKVLRTSGIESSSEQECHLYDPLCEVSSGTCGDPHSSSSSVCEELNQDGLLYLAGWLAKKYQKKYPELSNHTQLNLKHNYDLPSWIKHLTFDGMIEPNKWWEGQVKAFESFFQKICGKGSITRKDVTKDLFKKVRAQSEVPSEIMKELILQRVYIRIKFLNAELISLRQKEKNSRQMTS